MSLEPGDPREGVRPCACPSCGYVLDAATAVKGNARPKRGDISVCGMCGLMLVFGPELELLRMPMALFEELPCELQLELMQARALAAYARAKGGLG